MDNEKLRTAIVYDFDGTLARGNLQERSFIPAIDMTREEFWALVKQTTKQHDADEILVYMHLMLEQARRKGIQVTRDQLREHGRDAELFNGLSGSAWFRRIDRFGEQSGLEIEHYIVSSGVEEMISGCTIHPNFTRVFASRFIYDEEGVARWPGVAINYTTKTQFLFRINKGVPNVWDNASVNAYRPDGARPVPFKRMIFIGDGDTDVPSMKMTTHQGGHSIAVYDPARSAADVSRVHRLIADGRVDFVAPADYDENSHLDIIVKGILGRIARGADRGR